MAYKWNKLICIKQDKKKKRKTEMKQKKTGTVLFQLQSSIHLKKKLNQLEAVSVVSGGTFVYLLTNASVNMQILKMFHASWNVVIVACVDRSRY